MNESPHPWNIRTVPQQFWDRIEGAGGDLRVFKGLLSELSEGQLRQMAEQYGGLARSLVTGGHDRFPEELREELTETLEEIANWVITQGRDYYERILEHPEGFPPRGRIHRPIFAGAIIEVYTGKFGPWRGSEE